MALWKGSVEQILSASSVQQQREMANTQVLRDKLFRLHSEVERLRNAINNLPDSPCPPAASPQQAAPGSPPGFPGEFAL